MLVVHNNILWKKQFFKIKTNVKNVATICRYTIKIEYIILYGRKPAAASSC